MASNPLVFTLILCSRPSRRLVACCEESIIYLIWIKYYPAQLQNCFTEQRQIPLPATAASRWPDSRERRCARRLVSDTNDLTVTEFDRQCVAVFVIMVAGSAHETGRKTPSARDPPNGTRRLSALLSVQRNPVVFYYCLPLGAILVNKLVNLMLLAWLLNIKAQCLEPFLK